MVERTAISPRTRFEVFKRDKFTCQYCGRSAPEVVLQVDHIKPVAAGGDNDLLNCITSCHGCNSGKGAVPLSDDTAIAKQHAMLAELEERRQQLDMMMRWRDELQGLATDAVDQIEVRITARTGFYLTEHDKASVRKWIKTGGVKRVLEAFDESFDTYLEFDGAAVTSDSFEKAFSKVPGVMRILAQVTKPYLRRLFYIRGIIRNRTNYFRFDDIDFLERVHLAGESLDDLERFAKSINHTGRLYGYYEAWLEEQEHR